MQWNKLLYKLAEYEPRYLVEALTPTEVYSYEIIAPGLDYNGSVLFIGWVSQLSGLAESGFPADVPLLCIEDVPAEGLPFSNMALLNEDVELELTVQAIVTQFTDESRTRANMQRLVAEYNSNRGLQNLVDTAAAMLDNPLIVADVSFKILAISQKGFSGRPDIEVQRELGYILTENVDDLKRDHVHEQARKKRQPFYSRKTGSDDAWMSTLIYLNGVEVGHIDVMEQNHPFADGDFELLQFLSELVALELQKNDFYKANRGFMHSFFLSELLDGQIPDTEIVNLRLQHLNWNPTVYLYIMMITDSQPGGMEGKSKIITQQLHDLFPASRWAMYNSVPVFLLSMPDDSTQFMEPESPLQEYLAINQLTASISSRFADLLNTRKHYLQATKALELGRRLNGEDVLYFYPDYICQHIGEIVGEKYDLADFLHPAIPEILRYDVEHKTNLLETLDQHLRYGENPTLVAGNLFIHRNTLFYRIGKIKELFGLDLSNGEERMKLLLSMKFLQLLNK